MVKKEEVYILKKEESERIGILKLLSIVLVVYIHPYNEGMEFANEEISLNIPFWLKTFKTLYPKIWIGWLFQWVL